MIAPAACWSAARAWSRATTEPDCRSNSSCARCNCSSLKTFAALLRSSAPCLPDRGLELIFLDAIEGRAFLDQVALLEQDHVQKPCHPRPDLDAIDRFDPPDEIQRLGDRFALGHDRADRNG